MICTIMSDELRSFLYPFGFLANIAFGLRFIIQWAESEKRGQSIVTPIFWKLSLAGDLLLFGHCFIQQHFPMCIVQSLNAVLFWRNLNLMGPKEHHVSFQRVIGMLFLAGCITVFLFLCNGVWLAPPHSFTPVQHVSWLVHCLGVVGIICYSLRFWIQWWQLEHHQISTLNNTFWLLSLSGSLFCATYFSLLSDWVNLIGPIVSFIPFTRNLWLIWKVKA